MVIITVITITLISISPTSSMQEGAFEMWRKNDTQIPAGFKIDGNIQSRAM